jgi:hypothetical protein
MLVRNTEEENVTYVTYLLYLMQVGTLPGHHHSCPTRVCGRFWRRLSTRSAGRASSSNRMPSLPETELQVCQTFFSFLCFTSSAKQVVQRPSFHNAHHGTSGSPPPSPLTFSTRTWKSVLKNDLYCMFTGQVIEPAVDEV